MTIQAVPNIAITTGEPAGIGPDICLKLSAHLQQARLVFIGCPDLLIQRAQQLSLPVKIKPYKKNYTSLTTKGEMEVLEVPVEKAVKSGQLDTANSQYVLTVLQRAVDGCKSGEFDGIVTAPIHKGIINKSGIPFTGHTEWFASATNTSHVVMMLACEGLRVALATTHLPLSQVASAITKSSLERTVLTLHKALQQTFRIVEPKILICGLNPHAGENGYLGREEIDTIIPVLKKCQETGMDLVGPLPADTLFSPTRLQEADAVLAMYHDQGLPVLKFKGFGEAVNITLGLPMVRTSVDHGTAIDLAGTGLANETSLQYAVRYATSMLAYHR